MRTASTPLLNASLAARGCAIDAREPGSQVVVWQPITGISLLHHPVADSLRTLTVLGLIVFSWLPVLAVLTGIALVLVPSATPALADLARDGGALAVVLTLVGAAPSALRGRMQRLGARHIRR